MSRVGLELVSLRLHLRLRLSAKAKATRRQTARLSLTFAPLRSPPVILMSLGSRVHVSAPSRVGYLRPKFEVKGISQSLFRSRYIVDTDFCPQVTRACFGGMPDPRTSTSLYLTLFGDSCALSWGGDCIGHKDITQTAFGSFLALG